MSTLSYEKEPCPRCGGSGRYSYNQIDGSRCYGCGGTGQRLTKRGAATKRFMDGLLEIPVEDVRVGDFIRVTGYGGFRMTVREITKEVMSYHVTKDGERIPKTTYFFHCPQFSRGLSEGCKVRRRPTEEEIALGMRYQDSLTKAGKPRKGSEFDNDSVIEED